MRKPSHGERPVATDAAPSHPSTSIARRRFLLYFGAGGAGVATTALAKGPAAAVTPAPDAAAPDTATGYRETEHVRDYYRSAKL